VPPQAIPANLAAPRGCVPARRNGECLLMAVIRQSSLAWLGPRQAPTSTLFSALRSSVANFPCPSFPRSTSAVPRTPSHRPPGRRAPASGTTRPSARRPPSGRTPPSSSTAVQRRARQRSQVLSSTGAVRSRSRSSCTILLTALPMDPEELSTAWTVGPIRGPDPLEQQDRPVGRQHGLDALDRLDQGCAAPISDRNSRK
jgi:hypothetical protein